MDQLAALLLIVGCTSDSAVCTEIPAPTPVYRSVAECEAAKPLAVRLTTTYDQRVLATCHGVAPAMLDSATSVDWAVSRAGNLTVALTSEPNLVASR